jgi:hypothetical protein
MSKNISELYRATDEVKSRFFVTKNQNSVSQIPRNNSADLRVLMALVDTSVQPVFSSNRRVWGVYIVWLKHLVVSLCWPIVRIALRRQIELNHHVWSLAFDSLNFHDEIRNLRHEVDSLKAKINEKN